MSYDLTVYTKQAVSVESIGRLYRDIYGDDEPVVATASTGPAVNASDVVSIDRFEFDGLLAIEPEDVPDHVGKVAKGLRCIYQLGMPYSAPGNLAVHVDSFGRFARGIADAGKGVWVDEQSGEVWRGERLVAVEPQASGVRYDEVELRWCVAWDRLPAEAIDLYVDMCSRHLPEALPRRYGGAEPFQHRFESGVEEFRDTWRSTRIHMSFTAAKPCVGGHFDGWESFVP